MPPLSIAAISRLAEAVLEHVSPECLLSPRPFPVLEVFEEILQNFGIDTYPVADDELPDAEAVTNPDGQRGDRITIRIRESAFDELVEGGRTALRHRATLPHELGHALLHVPVIRRQLEHPGRIHLLQRRFESEIQVFEQSEWQAWTFAGCVLMPIRTMRNLGTASLEEIANRYEVSERMAASHIKRMCNSRLIGRTQILTCS
jgi:hypothetical protein